VRIASLQAMTNLSVTLTYHLQFLPFTDSLVDVVTTSTDVKLILQLLRLLANLTLSSVFVDHMLKTRVSNVILHSMSLFVVGQFMVVARQ